MRFLLCYVMGIVEDDIKPAKAIKLNQVTNTSTETVSKDTLFMDTMKSPGELPQCVQIAVRRKTHRCHDAGNCQWSLTQCRLTFFRQRAKVIIIDMSHLQSFSWRATNSPYTKNNSKKQVAPGSRVESHILTVPCCIWLNARYNVVTWVFCLILCLKPDKYRSIPLLTFFTASTAALFILCHLCRKHVVNQCPSTRTFMCVKLRGLRTSSCSER